MKKTSYILLPLVLLLLYSCKKDNKPDVKKDPVVKTADPVVKAVIQRTVFDVSGKPSYQLLIAGINFNKDFKDHEVLFNDLPAKAVAGDSTYFQVVVPDAVLATETNVTIVMGGKNFVYAQPFKAEQIAPEISRLNTEEGMHGSKLIISGALFSPVPGENSITLNGVKLAIDSMVSQDYVGSTSGGGVYGGIYGGVNRDIYTGVELSTTIPQNASSGKLVVTSYGKSVTYPYDVKVLSSTFSFINSTRIKSLSFDAAGNAYGTVDNTVVKITPGGTVSVMATIGDAYFRLGDCVADAAGNVYVASGDDYSGLIGPVGPTYRYTENSSKIYKITSGGELSVFAGSTWGGADGQGTDAQFSSPVHIARNAKTGDLYVGDFLVMRKITAGGLVSTLAGYNPPGGPDYQLKDGQGTDARFRQLNAITVDQRNGDIYVIDDTNTGDLRKVTAGGLVSTPTITSSEPPGARFPVYFSSTFAVGIAVDASGNIFTATGEDIFQIKAGVIYNAHLNPLGEGISALTFDGSGKLRFNVDKKLYKISL